MQRNDSQLVVEQVSRESKDKEERMKRFKIEKYQESKIVRQIS
jgi:ribonuclease HI